jgi:chemotaxis protein methyltransferase CheR
VSVMNLSAAERLDFRPADFQFIRNILKSYAGIDLKEGKQELVYSRLSKRLRRLGMINFSDYCQVLQKDSSELLQCINALTTNVTHFLREEHHLDFLRTLLITRNGSQPFRIWSAGCSSGEEPYSIAMVCVDALETEVQAISILGTDLDSHVLEKAQLGIYNSKDVSNLNPNQLKASFMRGRGQRNGQVKLRNEVKSLVEFEQLNLKDNWQFGSSFNVIFCRNVMIYFDAELKKRLFEKFYDTLVPGGYLVLGHSESLFGLSNKFTNVGRTIYQKVGG